MNGRDTSGDHVIALPVKGSASGRMEIREERGKPSFSLG